METKKTVSRDQEIIFTNWTDKDFAGIWNKKIYPLKAGKSYYLPFYLAEHFAKHLSEREYNRAFIGKLDQLKDKIGSQVDRRTLEHRVENSNEVRKVSHQEMMDKCVTIIPQEESDVNVIKPKEAELKEVILRRDERGQELQEKYGKEIGVQINQKALEQKDEEVDEEFEEENKN